MRKRIVQAAMVVTGLAISLAAQLPNDVVTLKIPLKSLNYENIRIKDSKPIYAATVITRGGVTYVNGFSISVGESLPSMFEARIDKISKKKEYTEIEMDSPTTVVKLRFESEYNTSFWDIAVRGNRSSDEAQRFATEAYRALAKKSFTGLLATLSEDSQIGLIRFLHQNAGSVSVSTEIFKERIYLAADMGDFNTVLNDARFNQIGRVSYLFNEKLLKVLKDISAPIAGARQVDGIKLAVKVLHRNFVTENMAHSDNLIIYAPAELITKFSSADITSQQLVDGCVIMVNENRVSVPLAMP